MEAKISDHWGVVLKYRIHERGNGDGCGPDRAAKPRMDKMLKEDWENYKACVMEFVNTERDKCPDDPIERLRATQQGTLLALEAQTKKGQQRKEQEWERAKGRPMSKEVKLRGDRARRREKGENIEKYSTRARTI